MSKLNVFLISITSVVLIGCFICAGISGCSVDESKPKLLTEIDVVPLSVSKGFSHNYDVLAAFVVHEGKHLLCMSSSYYSEDQKVIAEALIRAVIADASLETIKFTGYMEGENFIVCKVTLGEYTASVD